MLDTVSDYLVHLKDFKNDDVEPKLSLEKAEEILRNVYHAVGMDPPENCSEILRAIPKGESAYESKKRRKEGIGKDTVGKPEKIKEKQDPEKTKASKKE